MLEVITQFGRQANEILKVDPGAGGIEKVRVLLERQLLSNKDVYEAYLAAEDTPPRNVLYEDDELGFCVVAHKYPGPRQGRAHDHGPAWAIYGQVEGTIHMTEFELLEPPRAGAPGKVRAVKDYDLEPGQARVYAKGQVHSPYFPADVRVIRIEGRNLEGVPRDSFEAV
ncbi:MAG: hypothetical protein RLZ98_2624 [Pseudomonadota bacterium]|jgi:predicted metal-dependent enzyme (double-stranded beta helix superfamily)